MVAGGVYAAAVTSFFTAATKYMEKRPNFDQTIIKEAHELAVRYIAEVNKPFHLRDDDLVMNILDQKRAYLESWGKILEEGGV